MLSQSDLILYHKLVKGRFGLHAIVSSYSCWSKTCYKKDFTVLLKVKGNFWVTLFLWEKLCKDQVSLSWNDPCLVRASKGLFVCLIGHHLRNGFWPRALAQAVLGIALMMIIMMMSQTGVLKTLQSLKKANIKYQNLI